MRGTLRNIASRVSAREEEKKRIATVVPTPQRKKQTLGNLTIEETAQIKKITFSDGQKLVSFPEVLYEILALVNEVGYEETLNYVNSRQWSDSNDFIFNLPALAEVREKVRREMLLTQEKVEASVGINKCTYCGSMRTTTVEKQIRSCDEPATIIVTCQDCGRIKRYG